MKKRFTQRISLAKRDFWETYISFVTGDTTYFTRADRVSAVIGIMAIFFAVLSGHSVAFAGPIETLGDVADDLTNSFKGIASKVALAGLGACIIWFFLCTNDEDAKRPLKWGKRIILAYIVFMLLDAIIEFIDEKAGSF